MVFCARSFAPGLPVGSVVWIVLRCFYKSHKRQNAQHSTKEASLVSSLRYCALISLSESSSSTSLKRDLIELKNEGFEHRNMYIIYSETDHQPRLDA